MQAVAHTLDAAAGRTEQAIRKTQHSANAAFDAMADGVTHIGEAAPRAIETAATRVEELTRRGIESVLRARDEARAQVERAGDATAIRIREQPLKSMLLAAAAGALLALLMGSRSRD